MKSCLDRDWTRKSSVCQDLGSSNPTINSLLDKVWTNSGCGQTLHISSIFNHLSQPPEFVQTLSSLKTLLRMELLVLWWTQSGHMLDMAHGPPTGQSVPNHSIPMAHLLLNHAMAHSSHSHRTLMTLPWHTQGPTMAHSWPAKHVPMAHISSLKK